MKNRVFAFASLLAALLTVVTFVVMLNGRNDSRSVRGDGAVVAEMRTDASLRKPRAGSLSPSGNMGSDEKLAKTIVSDADESEFVWRESDEERQVDAFYAQTDRWLKPAKGGVSMADIDTFVRQFKSVPKARKDECLHRALNLIPDDNVMLLAGILMDKSLDREYLELVYNDVLNRDEDVKKPILQEIFKDKTHPCWADTAWILDVTGELPKK